MKRMLLTAVASMALVCGPAALSETMMGEHKVFLPQDIKWGAAPTSLPAGAEAAVLYGDPTKEGMFALRVKLPRGYSIPPHTHSKGELLTIISGNFSLGLGAKMDRTGAVSLAAGSFSSMPPGVPHFAFANEDTVVQINAMGPWGINYVDPRDDPRLNVAPKERQAPGRD